MNIRITKVSVLFLPIAFWVSMLIGFWAIDSPPDGLPPIASEGLNDVWNFYLPLLLFTLATVFFFTRKRKPPTWENFAINKATLKRDLLLAITYLTIGHLLLGGFLDIGLHFPGPDVFQSPDHGMNDVARWVAIQGIVFVILPCLWLRKQGFSIRKLIAGIEWKRDIWFMILFWMGEFISVALISDFFQVAPSDYLHAIPMGILVNTIGAGLPVLIMIHLIIIPRLVLLFDNQLLAIMLAGLVYATFSLFDPGVSYANATVGLSSLFYIFATQTLIGMGKATFTVRTGNPIIHFTSYHILGARVAFDTAMFAEIFRR